MSKQESKMSPEAIAANDQAKFGVLLTSEEAMEDMVAFVKANDMAGEVATWSPGKRDNQLMVSSLDDSALDKIVKCASTMHMRGIKCAEIIRRLTLEDLAESLEALGAYDYISVETARDAKKREFPILVCKISGGGITIRQILDHGIRQHARVLAITLSDDSGEWSVSSYAITQYETGPDGIEAGEEESFLVADFEKPEDESDERSKFDRCRDAVIDYRITGGKGSEEWIAGRMESSSKSGMSVADAEIQARDDLNEAYRKFAPKLHAMSRMAVITADVILLAARPNNRAKDKQFGMSMADKFAALIKAAE